MPFAHRKSNSRRISSAMHICRTRASMALTAWFAHS